MAIILWRSLESFRSRGGSDTKITFRNQTKAEAEKCSNNIAEDEAMLLGLHRLQAVGVQRCTLKIDSKVVASEIEKECIARDETLERYLHAVWRMETFFKGFTEEHIERAKNTEADELAKALPKIAELPLDVFFQVTEDPSVKTVELEPWMINII
jgi:ribonuclease HI